jgi:hypothetical protein
MKEDSKVLLSKLVHIRNANYTSSRRFKPITLTKEGNDLIKHLFAKMHTVYGKWETEREAILSRIQRLHNVPKSDDYTYIPVKLRTEIENVCKHHISCPFTFGGRVFTVFLCLKTGNEAQIQMMIRRIYLWLSIASEQVSPTCSKTVNIYFYLIDKKKEIVLNEQIDLVHVNTAFTTGCQPHTNVHIFREEEWFRALVHESFHNLGFDFLQLDNALQVQAEDKIRAIFPMKMREIRFNETYCEMWAEILNNIFFVYLSDPPATTPLVKLQAEKMVKLFKHMMYFEGMFSIWQCVKILNHNNLLYGQLYKEVFASKYKEKTQGFSYYVLKSIYMLHLSQFLHFCATSSTGNSLHFMLNRTSISNYTKIIEEKHNSKKMKDGLSIMEKEVQHAKGIWKNTLRMSLFEATV